MVAAHEDLDDEGQTVTFPSVGTDLADDESRHVTLADDEVLLVTGPLELRAARNPKVAARDALQSFDPARINHTVVNDGTKEQLQQQIRQLICKLI